MSRQHEYIAEVDRFIGNKIRTFRLALGFSRQQLSDAIGVTHQQLQKYEKGINRISVGRLALIAKALGRSISAFYDGIDSGSESTLTPRQRMCLEVSRNFMQINSSKHQNAVNLLIKSLIQESTQDENQLSEVKNI